MDYGEVLIKENPSLPSWNR